MSLSFDNDIARTSTAPQTAVRGELTGSGTVLQKGELVAYDDGTIQRELDSKYGADIILVRSALTPDG